jgi:hypothetical protein
VHEQVRVDQGGLMSKERRDQESVLTSDGAVAKRPWHLPELQEVDVISDTEGPGTPAETYDGTTYAS